MSSSTSTTQHNTGKVIVGMSGGVDSSVAAALLLDQGYEVEGLFMKNWEEDDGTEYCTALEDLADAERACRTLNIPLHTANFAAEYWDSVFEEFLQEYQAGRTPNPDVLCNREIKFKHFAAYALHLQADYIATGHYVRTTKIGNPKKRGQVQLRKGLDANKDQSYFLQAVPADALQRCLFPLGDWQKQDIRVKARALNLHNHDRKDSTGICFIGERRFADFLNRYISDQAGPMTDAQGRRIGVHRGLHQYTIGQRQGLQIGGIEGRPEAPWYVMAKHMPSNTLVVTQDPGDLNSSWLQAEQINWLNPVSLPLRCHAKIRYRQADQACTVYPAPNGKIMVRFDEDQRAITPGQYIALYGSGDTAGFDSQPENDILLGGARICAREERNQHFSPHRHQ